MTDPTLSNNNDGKPVESVGLNPLRKIAKSWSSAVESTGGFLAATLIGWGVELTYGLVTGGIARGLVIFCILWFSSGAAFFIGTMAGFLFGMPKAAQHLRKSKASFDAEVRPGFSVDDRYRDNTNLEEVADWLTKIIIGFGIAEFRGIIQSVLAAGTAIGQAIDPGATNGGTIMASGSLIIGFSTGFLYYYIWARLILRRSLLRALELSSERGKSDKNAL